MKIPPILSDLVRKLTPIVAKPVTCGGSFIPSSIPSSIGERAASTISIPDTRQ
jgi:hypothetical protein